MTYYNLLITVILFVLFIICLWNVFILKKKRYDKIADHDLPFISVLVPARNEEDNIANVLTSLLEQDYPKYELIVLNDSSEDRTAAIIDELKAQYPALKIISGKPLEKGWTGKCFACLQLYEASGGEYILFTDADTRHRKNSLRDAVTTAIKTNADLLTLIPEYTMVTFAEKLIMPLLTFTIMMLLPLYLANKKGFAKCSAGIGPFMLFRRRAYEQIGTHEAVKTALVEDVWLARKIKELGLRLIIADGGGILKVRMYRGFSEIWDGFSKNIFAGFGFSTASLIAVIIMFMLTFVLPFILLGYELSLNSSHYKLVILTGIQVLILYLARFLLSYKFKLGVISSFLHPFGAIMVPVIAVNSWIWIKIGSGAKWKGRVYNR